MPQLRELTSNVRISDGITRHNLTIFPLISEGAPLPADYVPLGFAIREGTARVTEVSEGGSVPTLTLENSGSITVLIIDGEELIGARQNRIANISILAPAGKTIAIPVSCVERGRWSYQGREFSESPDIMYSKGRANKSRDVSRHLVMSGVSASDQGAVWEGISELSRDLGYESPTDAMRDVFDSRRTSIEEYLQGVKPAKGQVGAIFAIDGIAAGLELFDSSATFTTYLPKILRSYALSAIASRSLRNATADEAEATKLLDAILDLDARSFPAIGLGEDLRIDSPDITGGALAYQGRVVHLAAFNTVAPDENKRPRRDSSTAYPLEVRRGHLLLHTEDGLAILDTGSPFSIGRDRPIIIAGREWNPSSGMAEVLEIAGSHINRRIDWLLGHDFFVANRVVIDWAGREVRILDRNEPSPRGRPVPIEFIMGVPVTTVRSAHGSFRAIIDSGASLSYVPEEIVAGLEPNGTRQDFYPGFGEFETNTWRLRAGIGGRRFSMTVGVLPPMLKMMLGFVIGADGWIVGSDFFRGRVIEIDYANARLIDITP